MLITSLNLLRDTWVHRFPNGRSIFTRVVRNGSVVVSLDASGRIYISPLHTEKRRLADLAEDRMKEVLAALVKLGKVKESVAKELKAEEAAASSRLEAKWLLRIVKEDFPQFGVKLTPAQLKSLRKATR